MPNVIVYDGRGNKVVLEATGHKGLYERLGKDGKGTGCIVNLKTALQCDALFTEEQHEKFLKRKAEATL